MGGKTVGVHFAFLLPFSSWLKSEFDKNGAIGETACHVVHHDTSVP